ncbi:MAG: methionyl-tRNA formyltransferase [Blastocatellia bacterium]|nr:methionyl-tRNA formyltransferase [Blastocatellia bacterium]MCS7158090.1 methionyl-tRNA formyltransferase [Blastocatellia bacterium]MDW8168570.1 methionyl-tRNA formyltransferase [Acidobacteriota bacterium]MDW8257267.1 methionyl-tRNA formyltransferase [Acidobacteriota bacterium]
MRVIFMGTPEAAVPTLQRILSEHEVLAVFTQPDRPVGRHQVLTPPPVKEVAQAHGIPVYQPEKLKTNEEVHALIRALSPEVIVVVAYGKILPGWLLSIPPLGCVNVHFSLLPKYRGAAPVQWAIAMGETVTGVTTMLMDEGLDTGPILLQRACEIGPEETAPEVTERLAHMGAELLSETLEGLRVGRIEPKPQEEAQASWAPLLRREHGWVDWTLPAEAIRNRIRGFQPWPGAWTTLHGARLILWKAQADVGRPGEELSFPPGTVSAIERDAFVVACGEGTRLRITEVQLEGRRRLPAGEFLKGARLSVGLRLGQEGPPAAS